MSEIKPIPFIKPTIGRRVWFRCNDSFAKEKGIYRIDDVQAMDAGIVYVHGDSMVNLIVTDHIGNTHAINSVALVDASDGNSHAREPYRNRHTWGQWQESVCHSPAVMSRCSTRCVSSHSRRSDGAGSLTCRGSYPPG